MSIGIANLLILVRVLLLWDKERVSIYLPAQTRPVVLIELQHVLITLSLAWFLSYCATIGLMTASVVILSRALLISLINSLSHAFA